MKIVYDVTWDDAANEGPYTCTNLDPRTALARLIKAIDVRGPITVISVKPREASGPTERYSIGVSEWRSGYTATP